MVMIYLPDTNAWIGYLRGKDAALIHRFEQANPGEIGLCSVVLAELFYGAYHSPSPAQAHNLGLLTRLSRDFDSLPFDDAAADQYGRLRAHLASAGMLIGPNDLLIASIALAHGLILVTHNVREFSRLPGLKLEDWAGSP
jgi:tRNA(fMet)-specific endonuclease VapC